MVTVRNSDTVQEMRRATFAQLASDQLPLNVSSQAVMTIESNPKLLRTQNFATYGDATNNGTTVFTTPTDKDFFLCSIQFQRHKDAASDDTTDAVTAVVSGSTTRLSELTAVALTAVDQAISTQFIPPLLIDRGQQINIIKTSTTAGNNRASCCISGFFVDNVKPQ